MDVLESRIPRPNQPDHGLYVWPQNMYLRQHLEIFRKAQASLPLGALVRGSITPEAAETFMESGLHEVVEGFSVISGEHISTALQVFGQQEYYDNRRALLARGVRGFATTLQLRRHFSTAQIEAARNTALTIGSLTPIMEWVNAAGYLATKGGDGTLTVKTTPYDRERDAENYKPGDESKGWLWTARCNYVLDQGITHTAYRYDGYTDSSSHPSPLLTPVPNQGAPRIVEELGWLRDGSFVAAPPHDPYANF